jgi:hypothetical protein
VCAQVAFGRRGGNASPGPQADARKAPKTASAPSQIQEEIAAAARAAFQSGHAREARFEFEAPIVAARALDDEEAMRAFIGPQWRAYQALWERDRLEPRLRSSLGLGPMLFGATWLVYRKQYLLGFGCAAAEAATAFLSPFLTLALGLLLRSIIGRYGKSLVMKAGAAAIAREKTFSDAANERLRRLRIAGGVTLWLPILLILGETWLALYRTPSLDPARFDPADLLAKVQHALP